MKGQSWYQSSCIDPKNLMGKKLKPRIIILGVFTPRGSTPGHPVCRNYEKNGFTTHFWPFIWALRSWGTTFFILEYETTNIEEYLSNFFLKFLCTRYCGVTQGTTPRGKIPKMIIFGSNFFPIRFFGSIQGDRYQNCPFIIKWTKVGAHCSLSLVSMWSPTCFNYALASLISQEESLSSIDLLRTSAFVMITCIFLARVGRVD